MIRVVFITSEVKSWEIDMSYIPRVNDKIVYKNEHYIVTSVTWILESNLINIHVLKTGVN